MKRLLGFILLVCAGAAQAAWPCLPKEFGSSGTYFSKVETADAFSFGWVCVVNGQPLIHHMTVIKGYIPSAACVAGIPAVPASGADPVSAANAAMSRCEDLPPAGSASRTVYENTRNAVYSAVAAKWRVDNPTTGPVYRTPPGGSAIYPVVNGKVGAPTGRRAAGSALCDCVRLKITSGAYTYCALDGGPVTEAVLAVKVGS